MALAEGAWAVADALRHAVQTNGVPAIYYSDRGSGHANAMLDQMLARLSISRERSIPRNSQARGVVEKFNQHLVKAARQLPTFIGATMDGDAKRIVHLKARRELREFGTSRILPAWSDFLTFVGEIQSQYNARPHRGLPKLGGRHQSPDEAWNAALEAGWRPHLLEPAELDDLARPSELRVTRRGEVRLWSRLYWSKALELHDGDQVQVAYDVHDASRVWVRDLEDRLITVAELDANASPYFPQSRVEQAREQRALGRLRRLGAKAEGVLAELGDRRGSPLPERLPPAVAEVLRRTRTRTAGRDPEAYLLLRIRQAGEGGITLAELQRRAQLFKKAAREAALAALAERGEIRIVRERREGVKKPVTTYFPTAATAAFPSPPELEEAHRKLVAEFESGATPCADTPPETPAQPFDLAAYVEKLGQRDLQGQLNDFERRRLRRAEEQLERRRLAG